MSPTVRSVPSPKERAILQVIVFEGEAGSSSSLVRELRAGGIEVAEGGSISSAAEILKRETADAIVVGEQTFLDETRRSEWIEAAIEANLPILVVVDEFGDPGAMSRKLLEADDWVRSDSVAAEGSARLARIIHKRRASSTTFRPPEPQPAPSTFPIDSQFFALVVHDLRTPLNVIGLSLRMVSQALPKDDPDVEEDMRFVDENFRQIERMLSQLSDFYRLFENENQMMTMPFSTKRMVDELLEARAVRPGSKVSPVELVVASDCPSEVDLDQARARMALLYALTNASAAAGGDPIRLTMRGGADRWVMEVTVEKPPPNSVQSAPLSSRSFERLCGFAAERRGMDLSIAAKVSEMFGGTANLVVEKERTRVILDWPVRIASA